jgi:hypothetical protein
LKNPESVIYRSKKGAMRIENWEAANLMGIGLLRFRPTLLSNLSFVKLVQQTHFLLPMPNKMVAVIIILKQAVMLYFSLSPTVLYP